VSGPDTSAEWLAQNPAPDLEALIKRWGGYNNIPQAAAWNEFHRRMAEWEAKRREGLKVHKP
jgi:hypothetical protein